MAYDYSYLDKILAEHEALNARGRKVRKSGRDAGQTLSDPIYTPVDDEATRRLKDALAEVIAIEAQLREGEVNR